MLDDILRHSIKNAATSGGKLAKTRYVQSALSKQGMRKNLKAYGYRARELNPEITPTNNSTV